MRYKPLDLLVEETKATILSATMRFLSSDLSSFIDDVVQTTYLRAYPKLMSHNGEAKSLNSYLYGIAKEECLKINEEERKFDQEIVLKEILNSVMMVVPSVYQPTLRQFYNGFDVQDISINFKVSLETVKSSLNHGRDHLRRLLDTKEIHL